jgi:hypothetical protein
MLLWVARLRFSILLLSDRYCFAAWLFLPQILSNIFIMLSLNSSFFFIMALSKNPPVGGLEGLRALGAGYSEVG